MADDSTKTIRIVVDASRAVDGSRAATRALSEIEKSTGSMAQTMDRAMGSLRQLAGLFGAGFSARAVIDAADAFTKFNNSLQVAGVTAGNLATVQDRLFAAANRNGVEIGALSTLYSRAAIAGNDLGATQDKLLKFVDGVTAALRLQGGSTQEASGALLQLSQAMGGGIVRAEEFNSILEGAFPIAQAAARGIDGMGGSVAKLRTAVTDGKVTSAAFFEGLLKGFGETEKQAAQMNLTVGAATTVLQNGFIRLVGEVDKVSGATGGLSKVIADLGRTMNDVSQDRRGIENFLQPLNDKIDATRREIDLLIEAFEKLDQWGKSTSIRDWIETNLNTFGEAIAKWNGYLVEAFRGLPDFLGGIFTAAMNAALAAVESGVNKMLGVIGPLINRIPGMEGVGSSVNLGRLTGGTTFDQYRAGILAGGANAASQLREAQQAEIDRREAQQAYAGLGGIQARGAARSAVAYGGGGAPPPRVPPPGTGGKGSGGDEKSYDKLIEKMTAAAAAQDKLTAAAIRGDVAFQEQTIHAQAVEKAIEIFGKALDATDPRLRKLEELISRTTFGKLAENFAKATNELEGQNEILEAQNRLMNEAPEIVAREIAMLKVKQEVEKAGGKITQEEIDRRKAAIEQNETLKLQAEEMKKANELWTAPLKQAFENIQSAGADAWETILETGNFTMQSLSEVFTKTLRRMAAEFLALATIRPVMTMAIEAIGPGGLGLIGGNTMSQMGITSGVPGGGGGGGLGGMMSGGGMGSLFSGGGGSGGGWLGRQFSGVSSFLQQPIYGGMGSAGMTGSPFYGPPSPSAGMFSGSGPSWGQGLGAAASIGMGAFNLIKGGQSTGGTIGSIGQMAGGVISMLPIPGAQFVGPAISLLSSIIPGLFGDSGPKVPPQPAFAFGGGAFNASGTGYAYEGGSVGSGTSMATQAEALAGSLTKAFRAAGLAVVPGQLIGGGLGYGINNVRSGDGWQASPETSTELRLPGGGRERLTSNDTSRNVEQASEFLLAQAFKANVLRGGVSGAGAGLRAGLEKINPTTSEDLDRVVSLGTAYDRLGKAINPAKDALDAINASFDDLKNFAREAGLALDPINEELKKQSKRSAQDFIDAMLDPLAVQMRALEDERQQAITSAQYIRDNIEGVYVDIEKIANFYGKRRLALEDQFYGGAITNLEELIKRLTYGDLGNASPTLQLSGARSAYESALQGARRGDADSIRGLAGYAEGYLNTARQNFASSPEFEAIRQEILKALAEVQGSLGGGTAAPGQAATVTAVTNSQNQMVAQLADMVRMLGVQLQETNNKLAAATAEMSRRR